MEMITKLDEFKAKVPYPPIEVVGENCNYAELIQMNYSGMISELSAITQYVNHEIRLFEKYPMVHEVLEKIAMVEMTHLQMLGELIVKLGGNPGYWIYKKDKKRNWTPEFIDYGTDLISILKYDIKGEEAAIRQYKETIAKINDNNIINIINRIILDEEVHVEILTNLLKEYCINKISDK